MLSKMGLLKLAGFVAIFCFVASPFGAMASDLVVFPNSYDFGDVTVGGSSTTIITLMNLGDSPIEISAELIGDDAAFTVGSEIPSFINPGEIIDIEIMFNPGDDGYYSANLSIAGTSVVSFGGVGIWSSPVPVPIKGIVDILIFFDTSVANGTLYGDGPGNSADGRRDALRNQIEAAGDLITNGYMEEACSQLMDAYLRCDGLTRPPEFVAGPAAPTLACMILDLIDSLGCE
jgi:hypothetical protein